MLANSIKRYSTGVYMLALGANIDVELVEAVHVARYTILPPLTLIGAETPERVD